MLSLTFERVTLVSSFIRSTPPPTFSSAREDLSVQTLSEVVSGRLTDPATQSSVPRGWMETDPVMYCMLATLPGGSLSAHARLVTKLATKRTPRTARLRFFMALSFQETAAPYLKALTSEGWRE